MRHNTKSDQEPANLIGHLQLSVEHQDRYLEVGKCLGICDIRSERRNVMALGHFPVLIMYRI